MDTDSKPFWSVSDTELLGNFKSSLTGLTSNDAKKRIIQYGANRLNPQKRAGAFTLLISQFKSPIILILLFATGLSVFLHDPADALIIL